MMKKALLWGAALCAALLFMGCPADEPPPPPPPPPPQPFTLTVTGIPSPPTGSLIGASLMNPSDVFTPIATGMELASPGTFTFYLPGEGMMPSDKPFNEGGQYVIQLAEVSLSAAGIQIQKVYMYMGADQLPATYSFPAQQPIPWSSFQEVPYTP